MKIKLTKYIVAVLAVTFVLTGCSKNSEELASVKSTKQDILTFSNVDEFNSTLQKSEYNEIRRKKYLGTIKRF